MQLASLGIHQIHAAAVDAVQLNSHVEQAFQGKLQIAGGAERDADVALG